MNNKFQSLMKSYNKNFWIVKDNFRKIMFNFKKQKIKMFKILCYYKF